VSDERRTSGSAEPPISREAGTLGGEGARTTELPSHSLPDAVARHLDKHGDIVVFCRDDEGRPIGYPMRIMRRVESELLFSTYAKSAKVHHLENDPSVAMLSMRTEGRDHVSWLRMTGHASLWSPDEAELDELFTAGPGEQRVPDSMGALVRQRTLEGKRIVLRVAIDEPHRLQLEEGTL
jgi:general stress protein 26